CATGSKIAKEKTLSLKDITRLPVALREPGSGTLLALTKALKEHHINIEDLNVKVRLGGTEALKNFLLADNCIGFLPKKSIIKEQAHDELKILNITGLEVKRTFCLVQRQGSEEFGLTKQFVRFARSSI